MALSYVESTASGGQTEFDFNIPVILTTHVKASHDGAAVTVSSVNTVTEKVVLSPAATVGMTVKIWRETPGRLASPDNVMLTDFQDGSVLTEADLDGACRQLLYISQEAGDDAFQALKIGASGNFIAKVGATSKKITDLADGTAGSQDACTVAQLESTVGAGTLTPQIVNIPVTQDASFDTDTTVTVSGVNLISDVNARVICTVGGVVQRPVTTEYAAGDYEVANAGANFTLILKGEDITNGAGKLLYPVNLQIPY